MDIVYYLILERKCLPSDYVKFYCEEGRKTSAVLARACKSGDLELVKKLVEEFQAQTNGWFPLFARLMHTSVDLLVTMTLH